MTVRSIVLWMFLGVFAAFGLYTVKYRVQALKGEVAAAETQLREEKRNLHVLTAEWTYLNRPERLRQLATKFLNLKPMHGNQLADLSGLPAGGMIHAAQPAAEAHAPLAKGMTLASGALHAQ
jgi:cell division protein FtsL